MTHPTTHSRAAIRWAVLALMASSVGAHAQEKAPGIIGQNGWLFYNHEFVRSAPDVDISIDLIARAVKALEANGTRVLVALAPVKSRIYAEHLPPSHPMTDDHRADYGRMIQKFAAAGVATADINTAFMNSPKRTDEFPLYFRHDTHWSATGALLAAETIRDAIQANPALQQVFAATKPTKHTLVWATQRFPMVGDLVQQLPPGSPAIDKEMIAAFEVTKEGGGAALLGNADVSGVALLGSSYTAGWTHFPKAVSYALQRDVPSVSITADRGQWFGLDTYLRNDAFQTSRPKLLIWEMPERDLKAPPSMPYREARYVLDNQEWLARVGALAQQRCDPAANQASVAAGGKLAAKAGTEASAPASTAQDWVDLALAKPSSSQEYLSARLVTNGSKAITVELSGPGATTRKFILEAAGDEAEHALTIPLLSKGKGYTKVRLSPGATTGFAVKNLEVCKQPAGLLG